jgi:NADH-quinone oxidoreductase subunit B
MIERPSLILPGSPLEAAAGEFGEDETMGGPVRLPGGFALPVQIERVLGFGRSFSFWPLLFGLACCAIEMMALGGSRFDMSRFGMEAMRASPRQADGMIVAGWCSVKMAPRVVRLYEQIPDPKWVLAMGSCAISGNVWDTYNVVQGIDSLIPVDVYVPGCPPRPEALWQGLELIRDRVKQSKHAYDGLRRIPARDLLAASELEAARQAEAETALADAESAPADLEESEW